MAVFQTAVRCAHRTTFSVLTLGHNAQVQPCAIKRKGLKNSFAVIKNDGAKNATRNKTERKNTRDIKRNKTQNMPTSEELWGDSPRGLVVNAPFRSALS